MRRARSRGQLSLSLVETLVGVTLVLAVVSGFAADLPDQHARETQLNSDAADVSTLLTELQPRHDGVTWLSEVSASEAYFEADADALESKTDGLVPDSLLFRVRTPQGDIGYPPPSQVPIGRATVTTLGGAVHVEVWYV
ncbi:MAG: DUF7262 family protein [Halobacteriota archaeon]